MSPATRSRSVVDSRVAVSATAAEPAESLVKTQSHLTLVGAEAAQRESGLPVSLMQTIQALIVVFVVAGDNLRKGAALNAVQIAEVLINRKLITAKKKAA